MLSLVNFLESVHHLNHPLLSGLSALVILLLGFFVLSKEKKTELFRVFFFMMITISLWFACNAFSMYYFNNFEKAILWYKIGYIGPIFMAVVYYHFYLAYSKKRKIILYLLYFIALIEAYYLWFSGYVGIDAYFIENVGIVYRKISEGAYFKIFGMIKYVLFTLITAISFLKLYKKEIEPLKKQQLKYLTIAFFTLTMGAIEWVSAFNIPLHLAWILSPIFVALIAYAILKYQLMDIKVVLKKAFFYSIGIALISGAIFGVSFLNSWFADNFSGFRPWMIPLLSGIVAFIIGNLFWNKSQEAEKLKYEFITVAAHKLRTPLTEIKWAVEASKDTKDTKEKDKLFDNIGSANSRLIILTDELLLVSRAEAEQSKYDLKPADLEMIAQDVIGDLEDQIKKKNIKLMFNYEKNLSQVNVDKKRISSVIQILLENAISYTKDEIKINIDSYKNNVIFHIEDNGIGILKEDQSHIFSKFYRSHDAYLTETEGTGVGLFLAKKIIDRHDGKIGLKSEGKGQGSVFWFSLEAVK